MLDGPLVFVDIDTQRDFLEPDGALYVPGGQDILANLERLTRCALEGGWPILATACDHRPDDPELNVFPPHCLSGSAGQTRVAATSVEGGRVLGRDERLAVEVGRALPLPAHLTLHKQEYDVFSRPDAEETVARYNQTSPTFVLYGVATDYCVGAAIEGLLARGCRIALVVDAVRAIDTEKEAELLTDWARRGVLMVLADVVCGVPPNRDLPASRPRTD